jgi:hypothetical protein
VRHHLACRNTDVVRVAAPCPCVPIEVRRRPCRCECRGRWTTCRPCKESFTESRARHEITDSEFVEAPFRPLVSWFYTSPCVSLSHFGIRECGGLRQNCAVHLYRSAVPPSGLLSHNS